MKKILLVVMIVTLLTPLKIPMAYEEPDNSGESENEESFPYPKLDDLMKDLKDKRKQIEQQRLEEIKAKKLEQGELIDESAEEGKDDKKDTEKNKEKEVIPSLIVRLRGKHSTKYLCSYSFTEVENNSEKIIAKDIITDYEKLLKKSSLKVRANENINFQFSTDPKEITVSIWNLDNKALTVKRGCIKVPDLEGKYVLIVKGNYKNGFVKYAVVLDIRK